MTWCNVQPPFRQCINVAVYVTVRACMSLSWCIIYRGWLHPVGLQLRFYCSLISTAPGLTLSSQAIKCVFCVHLWMCVCEALQIFAFSSIPSHHALPCPHLVFVCVWIGSDSCLTPLHRQTSLSYLPVVLRTTSTALFSGGREVTVFTCVLNALHTDVVRYMHF